MKIKSRYPWWVIWLVKPLIWVAGLDLLSHWLLGAQGITWPVFWTVSLMGVLDRLIDATFPETKMDITPRLLDIMINGIPVYLYRRNDGTVYASAHEFSRFAKIEPVHTMRLAVTRDTPADWQPENDPCVVAKVAEFNRAR